MREKTSIHYGIFTLINCVGVFLFEMCVLSVSSYLLVHLLKSISLSVCLSPSVNLSVHLLIYQPVYQSVNLLGCIYQSSSAYQLFSPPPPLPVALGNEERLNK